MTERERQAFLNALLHPTEPSSKAIAAARQYRETALERELAKADR